MQPRSAIRSDVHNVEIGLQASLDKAAYLFLVFDKKDAHTASFLSDKHEEQLRIKLQSDHPSFVSSGPPTTNEQLAP
jgi:hypothetical protein